MELNQVVSLLCDTLEAREIDRERVRCLMAGGTSPETNMVTKIYSANLFQSHLDPYSSLSIETNCVMWGIEFNASLDLFAQTADMALSCSRGKKSDTVCIRVEAGDTISHHVRTIVNCLFAIGLGRIERAETAWNDLVRLPGVAVIDSSSDRT